MMHIPDSSKNFRGKCRKLLRSLHTCFAVTHAPLKNCMKTDGGYRMAVIHRTLLCCAVFLLCILSITHHLFSLQITQHEKYDKAAQAKIAASNKTQGTRGRIFDRNGAIMVGNLITQQILAEPKRIPSEHLDAIVDLLASGLELDKASLRARFDRVLKAPVEVTFSCNLSKENAEILSLWNLAALCVKAPAKSGEPYRIILCPDQCSKEVMDKTLRQISPLVGLSVADLNAKIKERRNQAREIIVKNNVNYSQALLLKKDLQAMRERLKQQIREKKQKNNVPPNAIRFVENSVRFYPQNQMFANMLGFISPKGPDKQGRQVGASGLEKLFDDEMKPTPGEISFSKDAKGNLLAADDITITPATNGSDIYLTIEAPIQQFAEEELARMVEQYNPDRAYAVMMDPKTGAVMAMAQHPTFNPNDRSACKDVCGFQNHCFNETFDPGSVMKPIPISYALELRTTSMDKKYYCEQGRWFYKGTLLRDTHHNMYLTPSDIIMVSSNIGTAKIALELNEGNLYNAFRAFGLGAPTRMGFYPEDPAKAKFIKAEEKGIVKALEKWDSLSITRFPIGQGITCTALQLLQAYSAIANNGTMMQPYIVEKVVSETNTIQSVPKVKGNPISPATAKLVTKALVRVVNEKGGTGSRARIDDFTVAGKTGTAQICINGNYAEKQFNSSFIGFVPAHDPQFVMIVTARNVKAHGGTVCGPIFKAIAERTLKFLDVRPERTETASPDSTAKAQ